MKSEKVEFSNSEGHSLSGIIDFPVDGKPKIFALFAHCFTCSKNLKSVTNISRALISQGIAVLRFDFTGLGQSEGDFSESNFSSNLEDLVSACRFLSSEYDAPQLMIGHSLGGTAVLYASLTMQDVRAVVTIGSPAEAEHVQHLLSQNIEELKKNGEAEVNIGGRPFKIKEQFLKDIQQSGGVASIKDLNKALLIIHSPQDKIVGIENAAEIYQSAMHPKSFVSLDGADHLMSDSKDSTYVGNVISQWASRYLDLDIEDSLSPEGDVTVRLNSNDQFLTEIVAGHHHFMADEPEGSGGTDLGPSPYDFLLSALGACTAMTLRMYATHKKIDLKEVKVHLTHEKKPDKDGQNTDGSNAKIDVIQRLVTLEGNLTEEQRKRLIEIADKCPIHKTLEGQPQIITKESQ